MITEHIDDVDILSRWVFEPQMTFVEKELIYKNLFDFPNGQSESAVWRKYAIADQDVHDFGTKFEEIKRNKNPKTTYKGFCSSAAEAIRNLKFSDVDGHGFKIDHEPDEGNYHAHVSYDFANGTKYEDVLKSRRQQLRYNLSKVFRQFCSVS